jgi:hypothetical protein
MKVWLTSTLLTVFAGLAMGVSPCPTVGHSTFEADNTPYLTAGGGCNAVLTIAANGSTSVVIINSNPFDGEDDTLLGIVNNGTTPLTTITLTGSGISGWDGDGICIWGAGGLAGDTFTSGSSSYCTATQLSGSDPQDYYGPNMTFSNFASGSAVTVTFNPPLAAGASTFLSLEGLPTASLVATPGTPSATPAPSSIWLIAIGICALGSFYFYRTRVARS